MSASQLHARLPPGYASEYSGDKLRDVAIAFIVIDVVFVGLRYVSQWVGRKPMGLDGWLMLPALLANLGICIAGLVSLRLGKVGYHELVVEQQDPAALVHWAKVLISTPILYSLSVTLPKVVILVLYHRIFATPAFRIANYIIMGMVIGLFIAAFITAVLTCIPLKAWWDHSVKGVCIDVTNYYRYGSLPNSILDLIMLVLPLPVIWKLQTSRRNRIGLTLTFLTGSAGIATSIVRAVIFFRTDPFADGTWASVTYIMWATIEPGCYLAAACFPCYRPLLNYLTSGRFDPKHRDETSSSLYATLSKLFSSRGRSATSSAYIDLSRVESHPLSNLEDRKGVTRAWTAESDRQNLVSTYPGVNSSTVEHVTST